jgi:hypothetical protein
LKGLPLHSHQNNHSALADIRQSTRNSHAQYCAEIEENNFRFSLTVIDTSRKRRFMKLQAKITVRLVAAMLVTVAVIGLSALATHVPAQNQNPMALKSIRTDKATQFDVAVMPTGMWFVELVLPGTAESKAATENLKEVAATL